MHTVALRTEATLAGGQKPVNLGQAFKVSFDFILDIYLAKFIFMK